MARIGHARVSTVDQDLEAQLARLTAEGCEIVRSEKVSGGSREGRVEFATVLTFLRPGDELAVTRLDRLGRDTRDVLDLIHECEQRGASVTVLDPYVSTTTLFSMVWARAISASSRGKLVVSAAGRGKRSESRGRRPRSSSGEALW
jgi:DNA invertase Pin-like site-specific DNA recombinase